MADDVSLFRRFRAVAIAEGISFLVLLMIAMPIKYGIGIEWPVKAAGWIHGVLFMVYVWYVGRCWLSLRWPIHLSAMAFFAALLPFAPFVVDRWLPSRRRNQPDRLERPVGVATE